MIHRPYKFKIKSFSRLLMIIQWFLPVIILITFTQFIHINNSKIAVFSYILTWIILYILTDLLNSYKIAVTVKDDIIEVNKLVFLYQKKTCIPWQDIVGIHESTTFHHTLTITHKTGAIKIHHKTKNKNDSYNHFIQLLNNSFSQEKLH